MKRLLMAIALCWIGPAIFAAQIQSICRLKGQEPIRLTGLGLVTGLSGTGDSRFTPMHAAVARALASMGNPVVTQRDVESVRNVALVTVTCEVPGTGGREGDRFDCFITSIGTARSLAGGRLLSAALTGPIQGDPRVFALAAGALSIENDANLNSARIEAGGALIADLPAPFVKCGDRITLVVDNAHASFVTANWIATRINETVRPQVSRSGELVRLARALDAKNIEVYLPPYAQEDLVGFVADLMEIELPKDLVHTEARVLINEKKGEIILTGEVELKPVMVSQKNLVVYPPGLAPPPAPGAPPPNNFAALANGQPPYPNNPELANLSDLLVAMNQAQVPVTDRIAIIKELAKSGKLHGKVIYE